MPDSKDIYSDVLTEILLCELTDLEKLTDIILVAKDLKIHDAVSEAVKNVMLIGDVQYISCDAILDELMKYIVYVLAARIDEETPNCQYNYVSILDNCWDGPFIRSLDTRFDIKCLDEYKIGDDYMKFMKDFKKELDIMDDG